MKSFKQFQRLREENEEQQDEQGVMDKSGVPNAVILTPNEETRQQQKEDANLSEDAGPHDSFLNWQNTNHNPHLGKDTLDVHHNLQDKSDITDHEKEHLWRYTRSSNTLNRMMYERHLEGDQSPSRVPAKDGKYHIVRELDKAVSKPMQHDMHVHTGVRFHPGEVAAQHPEGHIHLPAYTSTSIKPTVAHSFAEEQKGVFHVLHIHVKQGDKARYVAPVSNFAHERELVLPRHTTLKIHPTPDEHTDPSGTKVHVWHAEIHHQKDLTTEWMHHPEHDEASKQTTETVKDSPAGWGNV